MSATSEATSESYAEVDEEDVSLLKEMGLLRDDVECCTDRNSGDFAKLYDHGRNLAELPFESRSALQRRWREFARIKGFSVRVFSNSWRKDKEEGNAKYVCKNLKGMQQLSPGSKASCPFFVNVYGLRGEWKITSICLAHDHYRNTGFQTETFVEGELAHEATKQRQRDLPFSMLQGILEREMLPSFSGSWDKVKGKAIIDFFMDKSMTVNRSTASRLKIALQTSLQGNMEESYQKLEAYLSTVASDNPKSSFGFEKTTAGVFSRARFFPSACVQALKHCKHIIEIDGTHLKGDMNKRGIFLLATTKDLDGHIIVFGLALVEKENTSNWRWFLTCTKACIAQCESAWEPVFVPDRQKGILAAVTEVYPASGHRFCVRHIITNVEGATSRLSPTEQAWIFQMARSECENDFKYYRSRLADTRPNAATFLDGIAKEHWVTYAFYDKSNQPSYDEVTSNLSEAANNWLGTDVDRRTHCTLLNST